MAEEAVNISEDPVWRRNEWIGQGQRYPLPGAVPGQGVGTGRWTEKEDVMPITQRVMAETGNAANAAQVATKQANEVRPSPLLHI
jgi:hypothetical protein